MEITNERKKVLLNVPYLAGNEKKYLIDVIDSTWLARGKYVKAFETAFAERIVGVKYGVAVTSGTVAVHIALRAVGLCSDCLDGRVPKVAVPAYTCMSVPAAVKHANAEPVFIEVESETYAMDIESVKRMYEKTKFEGLILVHNYGFIARDTQDIVKFCKENNVIVIEDASEAHGLEYKGKKAGQFGDIAAFSCRSEKMIGVGEGGVVVTNNRMYAEKAYYWVNDARPSEKLRYYVTDVGWNFHMPNAIGAIGLAQVESFPDILERKRKIGEWYENAFAGFVEMELMIPMKKMDGSNPVYWLNCFMLTDAFPISRDDLMTLLEERGFETRPGFYTLNELPPYVQSEQDQCPTSKNIFKRMIAFPSNVYMEPDDVARLKVAIQELCRM